MIQITWNYDKSSYNRFYFYHPKKYEMYRSPLRRSPYRRSFDGEERERKQEKKASYSPDGLNKVNI